MRRKLRYGLGGLLALALGLTLLAGCGSDDDNGVDGRVGRSYVYGTLDGALASQLVQTFAPRPWRGETDGPLLIAADTLMGLSESQKAAAQTLIKGGNPVLVTSARQQHVEALHTLTGTTAAVALDRMPAHYVSTELYGFAQPNGLMRMIVAPPFPTLPEPEPESSRQERAEFVATWILEKVRGIEPSAQTQQVTQASSTLQLSPTSPPWQLAVADTMPAYWATCDLATQTCTNQAQLFVSAWMVYSSSAVAGQPTDYFIMQMSGNLSTAGCKDFYGNRNHSTRIGAYWLRQANMNALVSGVSFDQMDINPQYAPVEVNPSTTVTTGTTWSLSGTGTAGASSTGATGSLAFTAGVSYSDTRTATYQALETQVNIGASDNTASWTYDSWDFVHASIEPGNHACGGPGLNVSGALPSIIYGGTFTPAQSWVWQAQPSVRQQFAGKTLPVTVSASLLLGWTYYGGGQGCVANSSVGSYYVEDSLMVPVGVVGYSGSPSNGLNFDVSCDVTTNYGTIPLGPWGPSGQNNGPGNPGTPYALPTWTVNVPFAPTSLAVPTLATISPTSGSVGTVVTLTGTNLSAATTVNFGGTAIPSNSFSYTTAGTIQVAAPSGTGTVQVSVGNTSGTSNSIAFTYTQ